MRIIPGSALVVLAQLALLAGACDRGPAPDPELGAEPLARAIPVPDPTVGGPEPSRAPTAPTGASSVERRPSEPQLVPEPPAKPVKRARPVVEDEEPRAKAAGGVTIKRLVVTQAIEDREPVEGGALRVGSGPVVAFIELSNPGDEPETIELGFESDRRPSVGNIRLEVPAKTRRYRTWGRTRQLRAPGEWTVVVRTASGDELGRRAFQLEP